jgi:hypothetical protein
MTSVSGSRTKRRIGPSLRFPKLFSGGPWGRFVVEIEQRVDVCHQRGRFAAAHAEQHVPAGDQQFVAQLERFGEIRL